MTSTTHADALQTSHRLINAKCWMHHSTKKQTAIHLHAYSKAARAQRHRGITAEGPDDGSPNGANAGATVDFTRWASIVQSFSNLYYARDDHP